MGVRAALERPSLALFCSVKCPGKLILDTGDLAYGFWAESDRSSKDWRRDVVPPPRVGTHVPFSSGGNR